jgi:hypothetical protein
MSQSLYVTPRRPYPGPQVLEDLRCPAGGRFKRSRGSLVQAKVRFKEEPIPLSLKSDSPLNNLWEELGHTRQSSRKSTERLDWKRVAKHSLCNERKGRAKDAVKGDRLHREWGEAPQSRCSFKIGILRGNEQSSFDSLRSLRTEIHHNTPLPPMFFLVAALRSRVLRAPKKTSTPAA